MMDKSRRKQPYLKSYKKNRRRKMICQSIDCVQQLYELYGFKCVEQTKDYMVFVYSSGYFTNTEILQLTEGYSCAAKADEYECLGYSVRVVPFTTAEDTHNKLFSGFFTDTASNKRAKNEYLSFCKKQTDRLGGIPYSFVPCKYLVDGSTNDINIVDRIYNQIFCDGPQLIIVEAAAGFGKTCTSYELLNALVSNPHGTVPIMTELSKNRRAQIFKYVLLTEIDSNFRGLSSQLVTYEIKNGRVPLIIDGFDELLSKSISSDATVADEDEDVAQTMLSTIAQLFTSESNAKVVLTSRKSSISAGDIFDELAEKYLPCEITRIQLITPNAATWIGESKAKLLKESGINLDNIANPALLAFISATSEESIQTQFKTADDILNQYFTILLSRERERQSLLLRTDEQLRIMRAVAKNMVIFDISSCTEQDLEVILEAAVSETGNIDEYLKRYDNEFGSDINQPSVEEFYVKLSHHALLDRISNKSNTIGFINDFIFGYLIADCIVRKEAKDLAFKEISFKFLDLMLISYSVCDQVARTTLHEIIASSGVTFPIAKQLEIDLLLSHGLTHDYDDVYCDKMQFPSSFNFNGYHIENTIFYECIFDGCTINADTFKNCWFYNCHFYNITVTGSVTESGSLIFNNCVGEVQLKELSEKLPEVQAVDENELYERKVLEQYWRPGCDHADRRRVVTTLFKGNSQEDRPYISDAINRLFDKQILIQRSNYIELNMGQIYEIKRILDR